MRMFINTPGTHHEKVHSDMDFNDAWFIQDAPMKPGSSRWILGRIALWIHPGAMSVPSMLSGCTIHHLTIYNGAAALS